MLVVKLELHHADSGTIEDLGTLRIWNDDSGARSVEGVMLTGNYNVECGWFDRPWSNHAATATGRVEGHARFNSEGNYAIPWLLVYRALLSVLKQLTG